MSQPITLVIGPSDPPENGTTVVPATPSEPLVHATDNAWFERMYQTPGALQWINGMMPAHQPYYSVPALDSGVVIPDHSAQRIAAAQAKRERKAANKTRRP